MLNFFIALLGQAYEESMSKQNIKLYSHKATLNRECYLFYHWLFRRGLFTKYLDAFQNIDCFILQTKKHEEQLEVQSTSKNKGLSNRIKKSL